MQNKKLRSEVLDGIWDALGFVLGGSAGMLLGRLIGFNLFEPGYSGGSMAAIIMVGLGAGLGLKSIRRFRQRSGVNSGS